jgi:hypothetical protein
LLVLIIRLGQLVAVFGHVRRRCSSMLISEVPA